MYTETVERVFTAMEKVSRIADRLCASSERDSTEEASLGIMFGMCDRNGERRSVRMTDISRHLMVTKPAATHLVQKYVDAGMVRRVADPDDRRVIWIEPTDRGETAFRAALAKRLKIVERACERLGEEETRQLCTLFNGFLDALNTEMECER